METLSPPHSILGQRPISLCRSLWMASFPHSQRYEGPTIESHRTYLHTVLYGRRSGTTMPYTVNPHDQSISSQFLISNMRILLTQPEYLLGRTLSTDWVNSGTMAGRSSHFTVPAIRYVVLPEFMIPSQSANRSALSAHRRYPLAIPGVSTSSCRLISYHQVG